MTDFYEVRDGLGALKKLPAQINGEINTPMHLMLGLYAGAPVPLAVDALGNQLYTVILPVSGVTPVTGVLTTASQSANFSAIAGRPFNVTIFNTFTGVVQLRRSFDGGTTWFPLTGGGAPLYTWSSPASETAVEYEVGVVYALFADGTVTGTLDYRISQ